MLKVVFGVPTIVFNMGDCHIGLNKSTSLRDQHFIENMNDVRGQPWYETPYSPKKNKPTFQQNQMYI